MKRVLLVPDVRGWAWWHMCIGIQKYAPSDFHVDVVCYADLPEVELDRYDAVLQCSWTEATTEVPCRNCVLVASHGLEYPYPPVSSDPCAMIATKNRNNERAAERLPLFDGVLCVSPRLLISASTFTGKAVLTIPGVDTEVFCPDWVDSCGRTPRVGWCGQHLGVTKGYKERLEPLMNRLHQRYSWRVNSRSYEDCLSQSEMADWHRQNDVFLSTSFSEGCQMPILEAMACGVQVVATDAGLAHKLVIDGYTGHLVSNYGSLTDIEAAIAACVDRRELGANARFLVDAEYSWRVRAGEWLNAICDSGASDVARDGSYA